MYKFWNLLCLWIIVRASYDEVHVVPLIHHEPLELEDTCSFDNVKYSHYRVTSVSNYLCYLRQATHTVLLPLSYFHIREDYRSISTHWQVQFSQANPDNAWTSLVSQLPYVTHYSTLREDIPFLKARSPQFILNLQKYSWLSILCFQCTT